MAEPIINSLFTIFGAQDGSPENIKRKIFGTISNALQRNPSVARDIKNFSSLDNPSLVDEIAAGKSPVRATRNDVLSLLGSLELEIDSVLPIFPKLSDQEHESWLLKMREAEFGAVAFGNGQPLPDPNTPGDDFHLELFLRLEAIKAIFDPAEVKAGAK